MNNIAVRDVKSAGAELTQLENKIESSREELRKTSQMRDAMLAEIEKKSNDFNVYMAQRDVEVKQSRASVVADREQLLKEKAQFEEILKNHKLEKIAVDQGKHDLEIQKLRFAATTENVQAFITAVRRASGLLGI